MAQRQRRRNYILVAAFLLVAVVFGLLVLQKYQRSREIPPLPPQPSQEGMQQVTLFFATADGGQLVREGRNVDACQDLEVCVEQVVEELINGPVGDFSPTLPATTAIIDVKAADGVATVNFGKGLVEGLPEGSSAEMIAAYSVVDTICLNYPEIKKVKLRIDGRDVEVLRGHLDLREPLTPDYTLEKTQGSNDSGGK